ncbi:hypothetical protein ES703_41529 [subsurface metagenome]
MGLYSIHRASGFKTISFNTAFFYTRAYDQADAGDFTVCASSAGLLAVGTVEMGR